MKKRIGLLFLGVLAVVAKGPTALAEGNAGFDGGFFIQSADQNFKLTVNGRMQPGFTLTKTEAIKSNGKSTESFLIHRARAIFVTTLYQKIDFSLVLNHSSTNPDAANGLADLAIHFHPLFNVTTGMVGLPMDRAGEGSTSSLQMAEPPLTASQEDGLTNITISRQAFGLPTDLGVRIDGESERFTYGIGFGNGSGTRTLNPNDSFSSGVFLAIHALKAAPVSDYVLGGDEEAMLSFYAGTGYEDENATETVSGGGSLTRDWRWSASTGLAWRWQGWSISSEVYHRRDSYKGGIALEDSNRDGKLRDIGYYFQAGYFVLPKRMQVVGLASQIKREGPDNDANEVGFGLNYFPFQSNNFKVQADYTHVLDYDAIIGLNNDSQHRLRTMVTAQF